MRVVKIRSKFYTNAPVITVSLAQYIFIAVNKAFLWYPLACFIIACNHKVEFDLIIQNHPISVRPDIDL